MYAEAKGCKKATRAHMPKSLMLLMASKMGKIQMAVNNMDVYVLAVNVVEEEISLSL